MSRKKEVYTYGSLRERLALEWKIYALAFGFILIADSIGQIRIPIDTILQSGPVLLLHGFGNLLGPLLALPIAILLGMKREAVGACHSINREYHMALINNIYGPVYHGRGICRAGHQRSVKNLYQPGMENPDCGDFRDDRNIPGLLPLGSDAP